MASIPDSVAHDDAAHDNAVPDSVIDDSAVHGLRAALSGPVFTPADAQYAAEIAAFDASLAHSPDLVIGVATEADVVAAVAFAVANSLPFQVQATGHGVRVAQQSGVLITTRRLDELTVSAVNRTATIGAGVRWGDVVAATAPLGLLPVTGSNPAVGVVGFLLGGGIGPLGHSLGVGSDRVRSVRLVTATGDVVTASVDSNPELFWALRGGGGGFGIVTSVEIDLVSIPELYAGGLYFAEPDLETVLRCWIDWSAALPEAVTTSVAVLAFPPADFIPEPFRGRRLAHVRFAAALDARSAEELLAPLRAAAPVYLDAIGPLPLDALAAIHNEPTEPGVSYGKARFLDGLSEASIDALVAAVAPQPPAHAAPFMAMELRRLGGALARDVEGGSAVGARDAELSVMVIGIPTPDTSAAIREAADGLFAAIGGDIAAQTSVNFIDHGATAAEFAACWSSETAQRLARIRAEWDPAGVFAPRFAAV